MLFDGLNHACVFVIKLQPPHTVFLSVKNRISLNAELLQIYKNLKEFLSASNFEAGLKIPQWAVLQLTQVCKKCQTKLCLKKTFNFALHCHSADCLNGESVNTINFLDSVSGNCYMDVLDAQLGYWEGLQCTSCCHMWVYMNFLHSGAVPVSWMPRNLGERDRISNSVMAPREKDVMLGEVWTYGCPSLWIAWACLMWLSNTSLLARRKNNFFLKKTLFPVLVECSEIQVCLGKLLLCIRCFLEPIYEISFI